MDFLSDMPTESEPQAVLHDVIYMFLEAADACCSHRKEIKSSERPEAKTKHKQFTQQ